MLSEQVQVAPQAWIALLRAHAATTRELSALLVAEHGLTLNDFECLLTLSRAEGRRMRRVDLAGELLLTASGVTRLLDGLEAGGFVDRASCVSDRRVTYAVLTEGGLAKLREAADSHVAAVQALFDERYDEDELGRLGELLARLPGAEDTVGESCSP
jgi:DNA-binding MarR family transcriptional regulator